MTWTAFTLYWGVGGADFIIFNGLGEGSHFYQSLKLLLGIKLPFFRAGEQVLPN